MKPSTLTLHTFTGSAGKGRMRIYNAYYPECALHIQRGRIECGPVEERWKSAKWMVRVLGNITVLLTGLFRDGRSISALTQ